ncbi:MAG: TIGR04282 family arsenosugar biosynthesis glycosyltransferase [Verrucomicrobiota bacterium]|nr:TIGR04282 family arsenosugar biosynthesis glycosyltransferase [Verrucomicrobiota bacterium]
MQRLLAPGKIIVAPELCALAIMTKAPRAGAVKTRLQPPLTAGGAAAMNICFLRDTADAIMRAGEQTRGVGVYTPVGEEKVYETILPHAFDLIPQRGDSFGERLIFAIQDLFSVGFTSCCLIDSDSPTVTAETFRAAADALQKPGDRVVIGPSDDGGYYLIGMKKLHRRLFEEIDWSTGRVIEQTKERAREIGVEVHLLANFFDVDDRATLHRLCDELVGYDSESAPATKQFLRALIAREGRARIW